MTITITYRDGRKQEEYTSNRVTFPPELPYMIIGAFPKVIGKSVSIFLPDIRELEIKQ